MGDPNTPGPGQPSPVAAWLAVAAYLAFASSFIWRATSNGNTLGAWIIAAVLIGLPATATAIWLMRGPRDPSQPRTRAQRRRSILTAYALAAILGALAITAGVHRHALNDGIVLALWCLGGAEIYRRIRG